MAEFTDADKRLLEVLGAAFSKAVSTSSRLYPWQEILERESSIYTAKAALASKILEGMSGSWASSYHYGYGSTVVNSGASPTSPMDMPDRSESSEAKFHTNRIGMRGYPEVNFVPFNARTNSFGPKGPSLLGHPISYEVVGPTLKSPFTDWVWKITEGGGDYGGDLLEMDVRYDGGVPASTTVFEGYKISDFVIGGLTEPNGGLYLVITEDGSPAGSLPAGYTSMDAKDNYVDSYRYEIFRIVAARTNRLELHPNKSLTAYFNLPAAGVRYIRSVTIVQPYVTRLAAIPTGLPGQTTNPPGRSGRETTFVVVSPEESASSDLYPPYDGPGAGVGPWLLGGFTEAGAPGSSGAVGIADLYGGKQTLPIPTPRLEGEGTLEKAVGPVPPTGVGGMTLTTTVAPFSVGYTPKVVRAYQTSRDDDLDALQYGTVTSCLGYFPAYTVGAADVTFSRVPEVNLETGVIYYGPGPSILSALGTQNVTIGYTIHDPISSLWQGSFRIDDVQASRLTNLIDPRWVERMDKRVSNVISSPMLPGANPGRSDRAIFDTKTGFGAPLKEAANPGSMLDLGFRMVLFPAKEDASGYAIPDFDHPISSRELVIDPSVTEVQTVDIDYSAGVVRLSHAPPNLAAIAVGEGDIIPNGIVGLGQNNPRGEVVLFAACVPYSMEEGQLGSSLRTRTQDGEERPACDAFSNPFIANIDRSTTTYIVSAPYIGPATLPPNSSEIILDRLWSGPETGYIEILEGSESSPSLGVWAYNYTATRNNGVQDVTALGGLSCLSTAQDPNPPPGEIRTVVLRHDVKYHPQSAFQNTHQEKWFNDVSYGSSYRTNQLTFDGMFATPSTNGLVLGALPSRSWTQRSWGMILPSKMPYQVGNVANPAPYQNYFSELGLFQGLVYEVPGGHPQSPAPGGTFAIDSTGPALSLEADDTPPTYHGFVTKHTDVSTPDGVIGVNDLRFESTFRIQYDPFGGGNPEIQIFIGFVQFESLPPAAISVGQIMQGPLGLPFDWSVMGLWLDTSSSPYFQIWTRGGLGNNLTTLPVVADFASGSDHGPFTFVMETSQGSLSTTSSSLCLKTRLYGSRGELLAKTMEVNTSFLPSGSALGLVFSSAIQQSAGSPTSYLFIYRSSVIGSVSNKDLPKIG